MIVYTFGSVDYDVRRQAPRAVFSSMDAAKVFAGMGVIWEDDEFGGSYGIHPELHDEYCIERFEVDDEIVAEESK